jgi:hypothetical protein
MFIFDHAEGGRCADCADAATQRWNTARRLQFLVCCSCLISSSSGEGVTQASGTAGKQLKIGNYNLFFFFYYLLGPKMRPYILGFLTREKIFTTV